MELDRGNGQWGVGSGWEGNNVRVAEQALSSRLSRLTQVWAERARSAMGVRRGVHSTDGAAYFKELSAEPLADALGERGRGFKDYRVTFADGSKQMIRCSRERCYADLMGAEGLHGVDGLDRLVRIVPILRPGGRILEIASPPMTTGYSGVWLARLVGGSGAVVSLVTDEQGARFAARRYAVANLSIEHVADAADPLEALGGETNGAFDAIIHLGLPEDSAKRERSLRDLWRVLRPGGWMLVSLGSKDESATKGFRETLAEMGQMIEDADASGQASSHDLLVRRRAESPER